MKSVVLCASPRVDGNSRALAEAFAEGSISAGSEVELIDLSESVSGLLRDCRTCRGEDGRCSIKDGYSSLLLDSLLPADAWIYATPLYYYGMAASLKNFFDRIVCYQSASYPDHQVVIEGIRGKRSGLLVSAEEKNQASTLGLVNQVQEISRYFKHEFVETVIGSGNRRGEVRFDPTDPLAAARSLGETIFTAHHSDYDMDSERSNAVWPESRDAADAEGPYADS
jgi:multimeric flavodoxin WrbA